MCSYYIHINVILFTPDLSDDLFDVQKELYPVSAKWRNIGIALRLNPNTLDRIQAEKNSDSTACLTSVVTEWLKRNYKVEKFGEPTWRWLVEAVRDPAGGENMALASDIARRHKAKGMSARCVHDNLIYGEFCIVINCMFSFTYSHTVVMKLH